MKNLELETVIEILETLKAESILTLHTANKTIICDYMVLATVPSHRQMRYIANDIHKQCGGKRQHREDMEEQWVLIDLGDIIIHLMTPQARVSIDLESLWS